MKNVWAIANDFSIRIIFSNQMLSLNDYFDLFFNRTVRGECGALPSSAGGWTISGETYRILPRFAKKSANFGAFFLQNLPLFLFLFYFHLENPSYSLFLHIIYIF